MSDYGFATYDEKRKNRRLGMVNSKWPIFGPNYSEIKRAYKTIHLIDTYEPELKTEPFVKNGPNGVLEKRWNEKQLVYQFEHGYKFRPLGYAYFSGDININIKAIMQQTVPPGHNWSSYTVYGNYSGSTAVLPNINSQMVVSRTNTAYSPMAVIPGQYIFKLTTNPVPSQTSEALLQVPSGTLGAALSWQYTILNNQVGDVRWPYSVEIDDKYVKIYRNVYWLDTLIWLDTTGGDIDYRVKGAAYFAGTGIDCTVYLCPYSFSDMLPREYIPDIEPSNIGIWDEDVWDGGKVFGN